MLKDLPLSLLGSLRRELIVFSNWILLTSISGEKDLEVPVAVRPTSEGMC
jgi:hypothetical protein